MNLNEVRTKFLKYMESKGNKIIASDRLIPNNDPTTLFTGSGMQPIIPYLLGEKHPLGTRICNTQKCFRSQDIEEVGDNRHTTFFEMLGSWSFGDYFKREQIEWMYNFLTNKERGLSIDKNRLYFSCYEGNERLNINKDIESKDIWVSLGVDESHIYYYGDKKNWWSRSGIPDNMPVGEPGGPDSEMFYDFDPDGKLQLHNNATNKDETCNPNCDCGRFMEIGNNVFMAFRKTLNGMEELEQKNVDFGGGLERLAAAVRDDADVYNLDVFDKAKDTIEKLSGLNYNDKDSIKQKYRVILDHLRAATFLIGDGVLPGNKDKEYFVRRLIRRSMVSGYGLNINKNFCKETSETYIEYYKNAPKDIVDNLQNSKDLILEEIEKEEIRFRKTLETGFQKIDKILINLLFTQQDNKPNIDINKEIQNKITGEFLFDLHQTFGYPIEISFEIINIWLKNENETEVDTINKIKISFDKNIWFEELQKEFNKLKEAHSQSSKTASAGMFKGGLADDSEITTALHSTTHIMLAGMRKVLGDSIHQAGSNINAERLRFDFTFDRKLEEEEVVKIEDYVNNAIQKGFVVVIEETDKDKAKSEGVEGSFWDKYPSIVRVWTMKNEITGEIYSRELCGGPHINNTEDFLKNKKFKITKQEAVSNGVRRVKAVLE